MVTEKVFGNLPSGEEAHLYHIENKSGAYIEVWCDPGEDLCTGQGRQTNRCCPWL